MSVGASPTLRCKLPISAYRRDSLLAPSNPGDVFVKGMGPYDNKKTS
jgi:hypothetical protein